MWLCGATRAGFIHRRADTKLRLRELACGDSASLLFPMAGLSMVSACWGIADESPVPRSLAARVTRCAFVPAGSRHLRYSYGYEAICGTIECVVGPPCMLACWFSNGATTRLRVRLRAAGNIHRYVIDRSLACWEALRCYTRA